LAGIERLVVDTSVAVKWFFDEPLSEHALGILEVCQSGAASLLAPDLIYLEFGNAVRKRVLRDELAPEDGASIVAAFTRLVFETVFESRSLLPASYRLALQHGCTVYDAVFLAVASQLGADCVTADERFYRAVGGRVANLHWLGDR
jgi:predicted nucleic acid-binding protein